MLVAKQKSSVDFKRENFEIAKSFAGKMNTSISVVINHLIENVFNMSRSTKKRIVRELAQIKEQLHSEIKEGKLYHKANIEKDIEALSNLILIFNNGEEYDEEEIIMKEIRIESGICIVPSDWVVLGNLMSDERKYPGVIEVKNGCDYGNPPHILFFSKEPVNIISSEEEGVVLREAERAVPDLKRIKAMQVKPLYDENHQMLNYELYMKAPIIGIFELPDSRDSFSGFPYGAMFIADN